MFSSLLGQRIHGGGKKLPNDLLRIKLNFYFSFLFELVAPEIENLTSLAILKKYLHVMFVQIILKGGDVIK